MKTVYVYTHMLCSHAMPVCVCVCACAVRLVISYHVTNSPRTSWLNTTTVFHSSRVLLVKNLGGTQLGEILLLLMALTRVTQEYSFGRWAGVEGPGPLRHMLGTLA